MGNWEMTHKSKSQYFSGSWCCTWNRLLLTLSPVVFSGFHLVMDVELRGSGLTVGHPWAELVLGPEPHWPCGSARCCPLFTAAPHIAGGDGGATCLRTGAPCAPRVTRRGLCNEEKSWMNFWEHGYKIGNVTALFLYGNSIWSCVTHLYWVARKSYAMLMKGAIFSFGIIWKVIP